MIGSVERALWLALSFGGLSLLAVGGGSAVLPEMHAIVVDEHHWLNDSQFAEIYSLGQIAPGPNMTMVAVIGQHVAGAAGWIAAVLGFFVPSSILAFGVNRLWHRLEHWPWRASIEAGLAPLAIGLMAAGAWLLARLAIHSAIDASIAVVTTAILLWRKVNPFWLILAGGFLGYLQSV
jgi:chromate transporter